MQEVNIIAVTLKDVAREVGVSAHSVSAVLNGKAEQYRISPATQERIEKTATELGYDPDNNRSARQMAARKHGIKMLNNVIAVCSNPSSSSVHQQPFEGDILDGIENAADAQGMDVLMCRLRAERLPRLIEKSEVDGIIVLSSRAVQLNALQKFDIPIVHLGSAYPGIHSVSAQHYEGMLLATSQLIELGHKKIAFIGHDTALRAKESTLLDAARQRFAGFQAAMEKANLPMAHVDCSLRESFIEEGADAFMELWKNSAGNITAVVCYNDRLAMGVIQAAQEIGLAVPEDLSVVGFDGVSQHFRFEPFISSVGYDRVLMGKHAVEILDRCRHGKVLSPNRKSTFIREELPVYLMEGATTASPR